MRTYGRTHLIIDRNTSRYYRQVDGKPQPTADTVLQADLYNPLDVSEVGVSWHGDNFQPMLISSREATGMEFSKITGRIGGSGRSEKKRLAVKKNGSVAKKRYNMKQA